MMSRFLVAVLPLVLSALGSPTPEHHDRRSRDSSTNEALGLLPRDVNNPTTISDWYVADLYAATKQGYRKRQAAGGPALEGESGYPVDSTGAPTSAAQQGVGWVDFDVDGSTFNISIDASVCTSEVLRGWRKPNGQLADTSLNDIYNTFKAMDAGDLTTYTKNHAQGLYNELQTSIIGGGCTVQPCTGRCLQQDRTPGQNTQATALMIKATTSFLFVLGFEIIGLSIADGVVQEALVYSAIPVILLFVSGIVDYINNQGVFEPLQHFVVNMFLAAASYVTGQAEQQIQADGVAGQSCVQFATINEAATQTFGSYGNTPGISSPGSYHSAFSSDGTSGLGLWDFSAAANALGNLAQAEGQCSPV